MKFLLKFRAFQFNDLHIEHNVPITFQLRHSIFYFLPFYRLLLSFPILESLLTKEKVVPTIGFRTVAFNYKSFSIRLYDVGGGPQIRALWPKYYDDVS